jgi:hypothetical protein
MVGLLLFFGWPAAGRSCRFFWQTTTRLPSGKHSLFPNAFLTLQFLCQAANLPRTADYQFNIEQYFNEPTGAETVTGR